MKTKDAPKKNKTAKAKKPKKLKGVKYVSVNNGPEIACVKDNCSYTFEYEGWYYRWHTKKSKEMTPLTLVGHDKPADSPDMYNEVDCDNIQSIEEAVLWADGFYQGNIYGKTPETVNDKAQQEKINTLHPAESRVGMPFKKEEPEQIAAADLKGIN